MRLSNEHHHVKLRQYPKKVDIQIIAVMIYIITVVIVIIIITIFPLYCRRQSFSMRQVASDNLGTPDMLSISKTSFGIRVASKIKILPYRLCVIIITIITFTILVIIVIINSIVTVVVHI